VSVKDAVALLLDDDVDDDTNNTSILFGNRTTRYLRISRSGFTKSSESANTIVLAVVSAPAKDDVEASVVAELLLPVGHVDVVVSSSSSTTADAAALAVLLAAAHGEEDVVGT